MKTAILIRDEVLNDCIRGTLYVGYERFEILERTWLDNKRNRSCIPQGTYKVSPLAKSSSGKYRDVFHVKNVKDRSGILIHNGNVAKHSLGCLIIGKRRGILAKQHAVLNSKSALNELNQELENEEEFKLVVIGGY